MRNLRIYTGLRKRARLMQQKDRRMLQRKSRTWVSQQSHRTIPQRRKVRRPAAVRHGRNLPGRVCSRMRPLPQKLRTPFP